MSPRTEAMDTPNTRSRRKRELNEEDEGGRVTWGHDQKLRRMMVQATANIPLPLPSPTQQPVFGPTSGPSSAGPSKPGRRRPYRANRSLPSQLSNQAVSGSNPSDSRSKSVPTPPNDDSVLGDLLAKAMITFAPPMTASSSSLGSRRSGDGLERTNSGGTSAPANSCASPVQTTEAMELATIPPSLPPPVAPAPTRAVLNEKPIPRNTARPPPAPRQNSHTKPPPTSKPPPPATTSPTVPSKGVPTKSPASRGGPRVGLSSRPKQITTSTSGNATRPSAPQQRFKTPFLQQQNTPIRCSPRRPPQAQAPLHRPTVAQQTPSKLRAGTKAVQQTPVAAAVSGERSLRSGAKDAPSSDSVGDESFDSFDGMFEAGGEDIDAVLSAMGGF